MKTSNITASIEITEYTVRLRLNGISDGRQELGLAHRIVAAAYTLSATKDYPIHVESGTAEVCAELTDGDTHEEISNILRRAAVDCGCSIERPSAGGSR